MRLVIFSRLQSKQILKEMSKFLCVLETLNRGYVLTDWHNILSLALEKGSVSIKNLFNMKDKSLFLKIL